MSKENLLASVESNEKILLIYGFMPALELKKIAEDFRIELRSSIRRWR
jgi:hypothetical protein